MATTEQEERTGNYAGQELPVREDMPVTATLTRNSLDLDDVGSIHTVPDTREIPGQANEPAHSQRFKLVDLAYDVPAMEEDSMRTPKLEQSGLVTESLASKLSGPVQDRDELQCSGNGDEDTTSSRQPDYFTQKSLQDSVAADISRTPSSSNVSSTGLSGSTNTHLDTSSTPVSPDSRVSTWKDYVPSFNPESNRPVSVPNFQSKPMSRRREGPDYPNYPDQSFKALQNQQYPPPHRPGEPHHLRTRSSQPTHNLSFSSSDEAPARGYPAVPSGAKTAGNTPAQSPGLFTMLPKRHWTPDSDELLSKTPLLHPAHLQEPKE